MHKETLQITYTHTYIYAGGFCKYLFSNNSVICDYAVRGTNIDATSGTLLPQPKKLDYKTHTHTHTHTKRYNQIWNIQIHLIVVENKYYLKCQHCLMKRNIHFTFCFLKNWK